MKRIMLVVTVALVMATSVMGVLLASPAQAAVQEAGTPVGWGWNNFGQSNPPSGLYMDVVDVAGGFSHSLALKSDGTVVAWGSQTNVPSNLTDVVDVEAGSSQNLALKSDDTVVGWGSHTTVHSNLTAVVAVCAGYQHSLPL